MTLHGMHDSLGPALLHMMLICDNIFCIEYFKWALVLSYFNVFKVMEVSKIYMDICNQSSTVL